MASTGDGGTVTAVASAYPIVGLGLVEDCATVATLFVGLASVLAVRFDFDFEFEAPMTTDQAAQ